MNNETNLNNTQEVGAAELKSAGIPPRNANVITAAATSLGCMPKIKKSGRRKIHRVWTGFIRGQRCWRGRLVLLADGTVAEVERVLRDVATVRLKKGDVGSKSQITLSARSLRLYKLPEAIALGRRKGGVVERKSAAKAASSRLNGSMPARPGHRRRGRPRKDDPLWAQFVLRAPILPSRKPSLEALLRSAIAARSELEECVAAAVERDRARLGRSVIT